jgi:hypothetical protein
VIPVGGLSPDGTEWVHPRYPFFLPVKVLSRVFRGKFVAGLKRAFRLGILALPGSLAHLADARAFTPARPHRPPYDSTPILTDRVRRRRQRLRSNGSIESDAADRRLARSTDLRRVTLDTVLPFVDSELLGDHAPSRARGIRHSSLYLGHSPRRASSATARGYSRKRLLPYSFTQTKCSRASATRPRSNRSMPM